MPDDTKLELNISTIEDALAKSGRPWSARENFLTRLPREERKKYLGAIPPVNAPSIEEIARSSETSGRVRTEVRPGAPAAFDWRNSGGASYITDVKNQGGCGSCVAFGTTAVVEAQVRIQR